MIDFPPDLLRGAQLVGKLDELLEWQLDRHDVAKLLGVPVSTVHNWRLRGKVRETHRGNVTYYLPYRAFGRGQRRVWKVGFRLQDVEMWADLFGLPIDYETLPDHVQRRYRVGRHIEKLTAGRTRTVATTDYRGETR